MRIKSIKVNNVPPINNFQVDNLSDLVVIAGINGVGKTQLIRNILSHLQTRRSNPHINCVIEATSNDEKAIWARSSLNTAQNTDLQLLSQTLTQHKKRKNFKSSVLNYDSNRAMINIQPMSFNWDTPDPDEEQIDWNTSFQGLSSRFQDTQHTIFKKVISYDNKIAKRYKEHQKEGKDTMNVTGHNPLQSEYRKNKGAFFLNGEVFNSYRQS